MASEQAIEMTYKTRHMKSKKNKKNKTGAKLLNHETWHIAYTNITPNTKFFN